ncbi:MAG: hypothetical protein IKR17_13660 [Bacteroidales bacterium]|nr:hypothetical protein [Bacteroidales bacterium]
MMRIKRLDIGMLVKASSPYIILSLNGQFMIDNQDFCEGAKMYDTILFESSNGEVVFAIEFSCLRYFKLQHQNPNPNNKEYLLRTRIYVPEKCAQTSDGFIVDFGNYNIVVRHKDCLYFNDINGAGYYNGWSDLPSSSYYSTKSDIMGFIIESSIRQKKKQIEAIRIENIKEHCHPYPSREYAVRLKNEIKPLSINPLEEKIFHNIDELNEFYTKKYETLRESAEKMFLEKEAILKKGGFVYLNDFEEDFLAHWDELRQSQYHIKERAKFGFSGNSVVFSIGVNDPVNEINTIIQEVDNYISTLNVDELLESFTISNEEFFNHRAGKDDRYFVFKRSKEFEDKYINSLFPKINETIYEDRGYCTAESMRIDIEKRPYTKEEAELIDKAKEKYNKDEHRASLLNEQLDNYFRKQRNIVYDAIHEQKFYYQYMLKRRTAFLDALIEKHRPPITEGNTQPNKEVSEYFKKLTKNCIIPKQTDQDDDD